MILKIRGIVTEVTALDNFLFSLNATLPIFLIIVAGYIFKKLGFFSDNFIKDTDRFCFKVTLPIMLLLDVAKTDMSVSFSWKFVLFCFFGTVLMFTVIYAFTVIFMKDRDQIGAFAMSSARGSAAVLGVAFANNIFSDASMTAMMIMASVPMYNVFSVIFLTLGAKHRDRTKSIKAQTIDVLKGVITNPLILSVFAGMALAISGLKIPTVPYKVFSALGQTASPMALLVVGASFDIKKAFAKIKPTVVATFIKLILLPLIFMPVAISMGFNGQQLIAILTMAGSPTTVACYIMAKNMDNDDVLTSSIVMLTTLLSAVTLTAWVYILRTNGLL